MAQITVSSQIQVLSLPGSQPGVSAPSIILSLEMVGAGVSKPDLGFCKHILASLPPYFYFLHIWKEENSQTWAWKQAVLRSAGAQCPLLASACAREVM